MSTIYRFAADVVVILHMAYVLIVVTGLPAFWVGGLLRQSWARNFWIRGGHLMMILIVVAEAWAGITCPLTIWEQQLRDLAGQQTYEGAFIGNLVHDFLFYDADPWVFVMIYSVFGLLVVGTFLLLPPRWPWPGKAKRECKMENGE